MLFTTNKYPEILKFVGLEELFFEIQL